MVLGFRFKKNLIKQGRQDPSPVCPSSYHIVSITAQTLYLRSFDCRRRVWAAKLATIRGPGMVSQARHNPHPGSRIWFKLCYELVLMCIFLQSIHDTMTLVIYEYITVENRFCFFPALFLPRSSLETPSPLTPSSSNTLISTCHGNVTAYNIMEVTMCIGRHERT